MQMWRVWIAVLICGCGASTGKPLHAFPSRQELTEIAAKEPAKSPLAVDEVAPEEWALSEEPGAGGGAGRALLAAAAPRAKQAAALDCVARELARFALQTPGKTPSIGLRRFISARCGALVPVPIFQSWMTERSAETSDEAVLAELKQKLGGVLDATAMQAGVGLAREGTKIAIVAAFGTPTVEVQPFEQVVGEDGALQVRGRVLLDSESLQAYVNAGEYGFRRCALDPAVAPPEFALRCELAPGDDAAWVQLLAAPRGRVLAQEVLSVLALRSSDAARLYHPRRSGEARPISDVASFQSAVLELLNAIRQQAGLGELTFARKQSEVASSVTPAFFAALVRDDESTQGMVDGITLGLMAGWDVQGGMIRNGDMTSNLIVDGLDAERWLSDALERPIGRAVLLDADAKVLALGGALQREPAVLGGLALSYAFFEDEARPGARAMHVLERLARVRKARGLGRTVLVRDSPGLQAQLVRIHRGEASPGEALRVAMQQSVDVTGRGVHGFVWETQDLDRIEFPRELLLKGDLTLGAGVTYYRAPGGAWGQYTVLFVVYGDVGKEV